MILKYKKITNVLFVAIALMVSAISINADAMIGYTLNINGQTTVQAQAGEEFNVNVSVGSHQADIYEISIPKPYFSLVNHDKNIFTMTQTDEKYLLTANLGDASLINNINNTSFIIQSNHEVLADGAQTAILAKITEPNSSVIDKGGINFTFSNPTAYDVTSFQRVSPDPKLYPVVVNELVTYGFSISATAPKTSLKNAVVTLPVPEGFVLGMPEDGNQNGDFTQPGGAGTPLISNSRTISGGWSGNITGSYITGTPIGTTAATQAPSIKGSVVGIDADRTALIPPLSDIIGAQSIKIVTDVQPYANTKTLAIDSVQHNVGEKLFSAFFWNESNVTLQNPEFTITVDDGFKIKGLRMPVASISEGQNIINRFPLNTTFSVKLLDEMDQVLAVSPNLGFEAIWRPNFSGIVKKIKIQVPSLRPGDGTNTLPNHYYLYNIKENAGFKVMGSQISTYNDGTPVQEGAILKVNTQISNYPSSSVPVYVNRELQQTATKKLEFMVVPTYNSSKNFLERLEEFKISYRLNTLSHNSFIYTNFPGIIGPVMYLVSPFNTTFKGDVVNGDFSQTIVPKNGYNTPEVTYVKTLADGRQVLKIAYSEDPTSPHFNQVVVNQIDNVTDFNQEINFDVNYIANRDVMYGTSSIVWGNAPSGILFFEDKQLNSYEDIQSRIADSLAFSNKSHIIANGSHNGNVRGYRTYNNNQRLTFVGPNQLSGDNAQRDSLSSYQIFDEGRNDNSTIAVFSKSTTLGGFYRTNLYNGLDGDVDHVAQYLALPQRGDSSMTIRLTGPITPPQDGTVLYSLTRQTIREGSPIDETDFVDAAALNGDFSNVKSILFKVNRLSAKTNRLIEIPIEIADPDAAIVNDVALTSTYITATNTLDGSMVYVKGANQLATKYLAQEASLTINKLDEKDQTKVLQGAEFDVTGPNDFKQTLSTDADGRIVLNNLEFGTYTLVETKAPEGYRRLTKPIIIDVNQEVNTVTVLNTAMSADDYRSQLTITKVDADNPSQTLENAQFSISGPDGYSTTATTNDQGQIVLENLEYGEYVITEIAAPDGYQPLLEPVNVMVNGEKTAVTIENYRASSGDNKARLTLIKVDKDDPNKRLSGARFVITGPDGYRHEALTNINGEIALEGLYFGDYTISETHAPQGYQLLKDPITFELFQAVDTLTIENVQEVRNPEKAALTIHKVDANNAKLFLANAEFVLKGPNGFVYEGLTNDQGRIELINLEPGAYTLREVKAPDGYALEAKDYQLVLVAGNNAITITNTKKPALPQTGYQNNLVGIALISVLSGLGVLYLNRRKKELVKKH